ncbi:MAG: methyltransferase domain-containing protein [Verrucomicrobia bacterium]|nr:methyltransferase domain-containing protein [Verrucomicrobiota bacterium]
MNHDTPETPGLAALAEVLACPHCGGPLECTADHAHCPHCKRAFPAQDGILRLAAMDDPEPGIPAHQGPTRASYQQEYQHIAAAADYNTKYVRERLKRWSTRREVHLLNRLLASQPRSRILLELPCGGGRLSAALAVHADLLVEADVALGQVQYARDHARTPTSQLFLTASALRIPFRNAAVDGVVCVRLCHHLPHPAERERLVAELLRVARRFVILTFFDRHSLKNLLRRLRRPFNRKRPKYTMARADVRRIAARHGARLAACPALSWIGSGHRYALLLKP